MNENIHSLPIMLSYYVRHSKEALKVDNYVRAITFFIGGIFDAPSLAQII
jgi:hypothetical protein